MALDPAASEESSTSVTPETGFEELRSQGRLGKGGNTICFRKTSFSS